MRSIALVAVCCACGSVTGARLDASDVPPTADSASVDAKPACDVTKPFDSPTPVSGINTSVIESNAWLSSDELTIYFTRTPINSSNSDIYRATRAQPTGAFSNVVPLNGINTSADEDRAVLSSDGLSLYVQTSTSTTQSDISLSTRSSNAVEFVGLAPISGLNSNNQELTEWVSDDGLTVYFGGSPSVSNYEIYVENRTTTSTGFGTPSPVGAINSALDEYSPVLSKDGLEIFFASDRGNTQGDDIWHATRPSTSATWNAPIMVTELSATGSGLNDAPNWLSPDRCTLIFTSSRSGGDGGSYDIWMAKRP